MIFPFQLLVNLTGIYPRVWGRWIAYATLLLGIMLPVFSDIDMRVMFATAVSMALTFMMYFSTSSDAIYAEHGNDTFNNFMRWITLIAAVMLVMALIEMGTARQLILAVMGVLYWCWYCFAACKLPPPRPPIGKFNLGGT